MKSNTIIALLYKLHVEAEHCLKEQQPLLVVRYDGTGVALSREPGGGISSRKELLVQVSVEETRKINGLSDSSPPLVSSAPNFRGPSAH